MKDLHQLPPGCYLAMVEVKKGKGPGRVAVHYMQTPLSKEKVKELKKEIDKENSQIES